MYKTFSMELAGRTLSVDVGRVAAQANGAAFMHYGETTVLSTATASEKPREGIDFFPLSVEFEEKLYAVGKIPGGFNKREGKASGDAQCGTQASDRGSGGAYKRRRSVIRGKKTAGCGAGAMECSCGTTAVLSGKRHSSMP